MTAAPPTHMHNGEEEGIYVLEGEVEFTVGDQKINGTPGSFVLVARQTKHNVISTGSQPAKVLLIFSPAGIQGLFDKVDAVTDVEKAVAIAAKYGMTLVEP